MLKFKFLLLLVATVANVAAGADISETDICTDPTKNNCDLNAKCTRTVSDTDETTPKFYCECNEGYSGDGTKGNCQKPTDGVCAANCDFTKKSLCNYEVDPLNIEGYSVSLYRWKNDGKATGDTDSSFIKETKVKLADRITSPEMKLRLRSSSPDYQTLIDYGSTKRGWQTVTATIDANATKFVISVVGSDDLRGTSQFGIRKVEVEANC